MIYEIHNDTEFENNTNTISDDAIATSPAYPGSPLKSGSTGSNVSVIQSYLNAIRNGMFPSMTRLDVDGVYGQMTRNAVIQYQGHSGLSQDGVIGKDTWNAIVSDYESLPTTPADRYPGIPLRPGSNSTAVTNMQVRLNQLSPVYTAINYQTVDGKYGNNMTNAVRRFQAQFGMTADGVIGPVTWERIVNVHTGVKSNNNTHVMPAYPGTVIAVGSRGDNVRFVQSYLNRIGQQNNYNWPVLTVDGIFGQMTKQVTMAFQEKYNLTSDGIVGKNTWDMMIKQFNISL